MLMIFALEIPESNLARYFNEAHRFLGMLAKLRKVTVSFIMSVCPSVRTSVWDNSPSSGRIFTKIVI